MIKFVEIIKSRFHSLVALTASAEIHVKVRDVPQHLQRCMSRFVMFRG